MKNGFAKFSILFAGASGMYKVFFAIYLKDLGFMEFQIGKILAFGTGFVLVANIALGYLTDRMPNVRAVYAVAMVLFSISVAGFVHFSTFATVLLGSTIIRIFALWAWTLLPLVIMSMLKTSPSALEFGRTRQWSSVGYTAGNFFVGYAAASLGIISAFYGSAFFGVLAALLIFFGRNKGIAKTVEKKGGGSFIVLFKNKPFVILIVTMMVSGVWAPGAFQFLPIYAEKLGATYFLIGILMAMPGITAFFGFPIIGRWLDRVGHYPVFLTSLFLLSVRSLIYGFAESPALLFAGQLLHLITFPAFEVGAVMFSQQFVAKNMQASAMSIFRTANTLSLIWAVWLAGYWIENYGYQTWFFFAAAISFVAAAGYGWFARSILSK